MMHIDRNGQYSSYWCIILSFFRYLSILTLKWDIDTDITHTHTLSIAPPPPPPPSLSFFHSFPPFLPPLSIVRSFVAIYSNQSLKHTHTPDRPSNSQLIDKRSFLPSFVLSIDRWVNTLSSIDRSHTQLLMTASCALCLCESERVWCELIAL